MLLPASREARYFIPSHLPSTASPPLPLPPLPPPLLDAIPPKMEKPSRRTPSTWCVRVRCSGWMDELALGRMDGCKDGRMVGWARCAGCLRELHSLASSSSPRRVALVRMLLRDSVLLLSARLLSASMCDTVHSCHRHACCHRSVSNVLSAASFWFPSSMPQRLNPTCHCALIIVLVGAGRSDRTLCLLLSRSLPVPRLNVVRCPTLLSRLLPSPSLLTSS